MKEQDQTIRSLPDGRRRITEAYRLFEAYIQQIRTVESCRLPWATIASMATNPVEDGSGDQAKLAKQIRTDARTKLASALKRMKQLHEKLPEAFDPVLPMLKYSRVPLGKFHFEGVGRSEDGNHAYYFFAQLYHRAYDWALKVDRVLSTDLQLPLDPREWDYLSKIDDSLPLGNGREKSIRDRLDLEESQLLRDLPKYAEILGVGEKNPVTEIVEAIDEVYSLACNFVQQLSLTRHFAVLPHELTVLSIFVSDDDREELTDRDFEIDHQKNKLIDRSDDLRKHGEKLEKLAAELGIVWQRISDLFVFAHVEMGRFEKHSVTALNAIASKFWDVKRWLRETIAYLSLADHFPVKLSLEECGKIRDLADAFPIDQAFITVLDDRLLFEKSVLTRNVKAYAETKGIIGSTTVTTPKGRKKSEKTPDQIKREGSYLSLLAEYSKWQDTQKKKTGRKRYSPNDWLKVEQSWSSKSKAFFKKLCGNKEGSGSKILTDAIKYAQKLTREQASGD